MNLSKYKQYLLPRLFVVYCLTLIALTLSPEPVGKPVFLGSALYNFVPFKNILLILGTLDGIVILEQLLGNIFLFIPFGLLLKLGNNNILVQRVAVLGLVLSLTIELIQLYVTLATEMPYRIFDIDDIILNVSGAVAGYGIAVLGSRIVNKMLERVA